MIFRRKAKAQPVDEPEQDVTEVEASGPDEADGDAAAVLADDAEAAADEVGDDDAAAEADDDAGAELPPELADAEDDEDEGDDDESDEDEADDDGADEADEEAVDWRADGPFDFEEVDLSADEAQRLDLGALILTPWEGMGLQLQVNEGNQQVVAALAFWEQSGLELALLAAPTSGGLGDELREDLTEEAEQAGGSATTAVGPFGPELRRVLPAEGPSGEQLFQVSRTWFAEGPRWLLRGTLLGEAGLTEDDEGAAAAFVEFFRNVVVRRGDGPMVPGEIIAMTMPTVPQA